ncbi:hypothetical protein MHLP_04370 [Candidatus Mycoplasma haematolamae str. Purdue]|uniref:Uncharacterized protein n=1 Tax=Mycoplasma haematolamae (strain Purdue) TaxID=1212765 RepID=I7CKR3_MYCHA|nr:hypothetical protein MHLP_04370 [Candidatus Mycoplasma haematolamae str. Purdue]
MWYIGNCLNKTHSEGDIKKMRYWENKKNYRNAPEVTGSNFIWNDLNKYLQRLERGLLTHQ